MAEPQKTVEIPRPKKRVTFGLICLSIFMPWFALYLDGSSWPAIAFNFAAWFLLLPIGTICASIHAIICLCRTDKHRKYSKPARRRLRYENNYSAKREAATQGKPKEPEPAPVMRAVAGPPPARALTEPPTKNSSATSSSTSVSSSDLDQDTAPASAPPGKTATMKKDDPPKDPGA